MAAPGTLKKEATALAALCEEVGHEVTFKWFILKKEGGPGILRSNWRTSPEEAREHASIERQAICDADVLILLLPDRDTWEHRNSNGAGCFWEAGIMSALTMTTNKHVWIVGHDNWARDLVFMYLPECHFLTATECRAALEFARAQEIEDPETSEERRRSIVDSYLPEP